MASPQDDEDEQFRSGLNARIRADLDTAIMRVKRSPLSLGDQADMLQGMVASLFGAAAAARYNAEPQRTPAETVVALGTFLCTSMVTDQCDQPVALEHKGPLDG